MVGSENLRGSNSPDRPTPLGVACLVGDDAPAAQSIQIVAGWGIFWKCFRLRETGVTSRNSENIGLPPMKVGLLNLMRNLLVAPAIEPPASDNPFEST